MHPQLVSGQGGGEKETNLLDAMEREVKPWASKEEVGRRLRRRDKGMRKRLKG